MWQRIQTLYLILACAIVAVLFFCPLAVAVGSEGAKEPIFFVDNVFFLCLMIAIAIFNFMALVFFKHRIFQMRMGTVAALMLLGFQIWILVKYFTAQSGIVFKFPALLPLVASGLDILAVRSILSDQMMVESYNRLRTKKKNGKN